MHPTLLFGSSALEAIAHSVSTRKPLFVYLSEPSSNLLRNVDWLDAEMLRLATRYVCLKLEKGSSEHHHFATAYPDVAVPSFCVVQHGKLTVLGTEKEAVLRALGLAKLQQNEQDKCTLVIRLLEGERVFSTFEPTQTLRDVKRWLEAEMDMLLVPEEDVDMPVFAHSEHSTPSYYAFHLPGHVSFSESDELKTLAELGLCPRLALVLKPAFANVKNGAESSAWDAVSEKLRGMVLALYSFFDYGVDSLDSGGPEVPDIPIIAESAPHIMSPAPKMASMSAQPELENGRLTPVVGVAQ